MLKAAKRSASLCCPINRTWLCARDLSCLTTDCSEHNPSNILVRLSIHRYSRTVCSKPIQNMLTMITKSRKFMAAVIQRQCWRMQLSNPQVAMYCCFKALLRPPAKVYQLPGTERLKIRWIHTDGRGEETVNLVFSTTGAELEAVVQNSHSTRIINHWTRRKTSAKWKAKSKMSSEEPLLGDSAIAHEQRKMKLLMIAQ